MFCRRMSTMNAIFGCIATMYVKFWSGPTPRYTPPDLVDWASSGSTHWKVISFDTKLSERKNPPGSENSDTIRQYTSSLIRSGMDAGMTRDPSDNETPPNMAIRARLAATWLRRAVKIIVTTSLAEPAGYPRHTM